MSYLPPAEFVKKAIDSGEAKIAMSTRDTVIRAYMAGALLALAAAFAITVTQTTGQPLIGALLFPVGFCMLYLLGYDLLTGVVVLTPLALLDRRPGCTAGGMLRNWGLVFVGNFAGALTTAVMMAVVFTFGFATDPSPVGKLIAGIGEARTPGKVIAMWMPITVFFFMTFENSIVNMFLFPSALMMGGKFSFMDYLISNEIPTITGNIVGGIAFTGLMLYSTHARTAPKRAAATAMAPAE